MHVRRTVNVALNHDSHKCFTLLSGFLPHVRGGGGAQAVPPSETFALSQKFDLKTIEQ